MNALSQIIQAILFAAPYAIVEEEIVKIIQKESEEYTEEEIQKAILDLRAEYQRDIYGMEIQKSGMGLSFVSKVQYYPYIVNYIETVQRKRLSKAALETLSIVAFQPDCTKVDIEQIRGVSADYAIERLMERELIIISGRKDAPGQPATYRTSEKFYDYFGIESMDDLPKLEFLRQEGMSEVGTAEDEVVYTAEPESAPQGEIVQDTSDIIPDVDSKE